jgi:hypothetical protein
MRVEAQEIIKHHPYYLAAGDIVTVPDDVGEILVGNGWAKNVDTGEIGEREGGAVELEIENSKIGVADTGA